MLAEADILENEILEQYPKVLEMLLRDQTTKKNIFWATNNYISLGDGYLFSSQIFPELITAENGHIIMPRIKKNKDLQQSRTREMAEIFTPSWICNVQNNLIDNSWFGQENIFNAEIILSDGSRSWEVKKEKITFPKGKNWKHYIRDKRLEMACGEAPYITSRYDTTTGEFIPVENRIGLLDRKLRVVNENASSPKNWLESVHLAYKNIYAFEWQGDSLLLAREAMLFTFIDNYQQKFESEPSAEVIHDIAEIISFNIWQMDGIKGVIPGSCREISTETDELFGDKTKVVIACEGCAKEKIHRHNGIYCLINDWGFKDPRSGTIGRTLKFVDLIKNKA